MPTEISDNPVSLPRGSVNSQVLRALLDAKRESDRRNWAAKYQHLRKAIALDPRGFRVDQPSGRHWGVTHAPTGFRMHAPASIVGNLPRDSGESSNQFELDPTDLPDLRKLGAVQEGRDVADEPAIALRRIITALLQLV